MNYSEAQKGHSIQGFVQNKVRECWAFHPLQHWWADLDNHMSCTVCLRQDGHPQSMSRLSSDRVSCNVPLIFMLHPSSIINASLRSENSRRSLAKPDSLLAWGLSACFKTLMQSCRISSMYGSIGDFCPFRISVMIFSHPSRYLMLFTAPCSLAFLLYFRGIFFKSHSFFLRHCFFPVSNSLIFTTINHVTH